MTLAGTAGTGMSALADVQSRIAAIQSKLGARQAVVATSMSATATSASSATSATSTAYGARLASAAGGSGDFAGALTAAIDAGRQVAGTQVAGTQVAGTQVAGTQAPSVATAVPAPAGPTTTARTGAASGADVLAIGKDYLGVSYRWGGEDPATGLDCSGLTQLVYGRAGIDLPRVSADQARSGRAVASMSQAQVGDLLFFGSPVHHVAIYAGEGTMLEAPRSGKDVRIGAVWGTPTAIRRVLPDAASAPAAAPAAAAPAAPAAATTGPSATGATALVPQLARHAGPVGDVPYAAEFTAAERRHGVPARVLSAVAKAESGYRADATSSAGARGLMQFMPATARGLGIDPLDPSQAVDGAARLLARHTREFGSLELALAAYNAGEGAVRRHGGIPPYSETRGYVTRITAALERTS